MLNPLTKIISKGSNVPKHVFGQVCLKLAKAVQASQPDPLIAQNLRRKSVFFAEMQDLISTYQFTTFHDAGCIVDLSKRVDVPKRLRQFKFEPTCEPIEQSWAYVLRMPEFYQLTVPAYTSPKFAIKNYKDFMNLMEIRLDKQNLPNFELGLMLNKTTKGFRFEHRQISLGGQAKCWFINPKEKTQKFKMFFHNHPNSLIKAMPSEKDLESFAPIFRDNSYFSAYIYAQQTRTSVILSPLHEFSNHPSTFNKPYIHYENKFLRVEELIQVHADYPRTDLKLAMQNLKTDDPILVKIGYGI